MADDTSHPIPDESLRIDPQSEADISYWAEKLNLSSDQLRGVIEQVGSRVIDIEMVIGKYTPTSNPR
ncbi:MAG: DUF3606 domain-containing protein [Verrucomicrobiaceae bacterium]|nr:MAG: DUF3606 domain-containing protein [Verrucomicrobiaceae bacterium]